eukprot:TRINITY_DN3498_c0_g1_i1.p1 TRINITY_DN3498_c0_g1~~TRINITY_DN3498_c0_g1_i1.p1  ORF type:complete len:245 (-),score=30.67 TRINITY_DN3498_c0_g1_i1:48-782(-)
MGVNFQEEHIRGKMNKFIRKTCRHDDSFLLSTKVRIMSERNKRVSVACNNCQKSHSKCDNGRPCKRCKSKGLTNCRDTLHKWQLEEAKQLAKARLYPVDNTPYLEPVATSLPNGEVQFLPSVVSKAPSHAYVAYPFPAYLGGSPVKTEDLYQDSSSSGEYKNIELRDNLLKSLGHIQRPIKEEFPKDIPTVLNLSNLGSPNKPKENSRKRRRESIPESSESEEEIFSDFVWERVKKKPRNSIEY